MRLYLTLALLASSIVGATERMPQKLPSRIPEIVIPELRKCQSTDGFSFLERILGKPDKDVGSGVYILYYRLEDGSSIVASSAYSKQIWVIRREFPTAIKREGDVIYKLQASNDKTK